MKIVVVILLLVGIPVGMWVVAKWIDFWIDRSVGQWMAFGLGIPIAVVMTLIYVFMSGRSQ